MATAETPVLGRLNSAIAGVGVLGRPRVGRPQPTDPCALTRDLDDAEVVLAAFANCPQNWNGHRCSKRPDATTEDSPRGDHGHECGCGARWVSSHPYARSKFSGSGNCWCGRHRRAALHT